MPNELYKKAKPKEKLPSPISPAVIKKMKELENKPQYEIRMKKKAKKKAKKSTSVFDS